jgi:Fe-S-cluster containining protein
MKDCNQCGKCCIHYSDGGLSASASDLEHWETHRPDISEYARGGEIWVSPVTGKPMLRCPWLRKLPGQEKYICRIYYDRPDDCRVYPVEIEQMLRDGCEMLEASDLANPKQAQKKLDILMADSRPPVSK